MPFTDEDLQDPVSSIIKNKIAPMLARMVVQLNF